MQPLARTSTLQTQYSAAQVTAFLLATSNQETWAVDLLGPNFAFKADLTKYIRSEDTTITHDVTSAVKRNLKLVIRGDHPDAINLYDLIRPRYRLKTPDGGWIEWVLGTFTLQPEDKDISDASTWETHTCPELSQLLVDDVFLDAYTVPRGTNYIQAVRTIANSYGGVTPIYVEMPDQGLRTPASISWNFGETKLSAINDLMAAINYFPVWFDAFGVMRSKPIPNWDTVSPLFTFDATSGASPIKTPIRIRPQISLIYNAAVVVVEDPRKLRYKRQYLNVNPANPISIPNWHRKTKVLRQSMIVDSNTAYNIARSAVQAASRQYSQIQLDTFPWALSEDSDIYRVRYSTRDEGTVDALWMEAGWTHTFKKASTTTHKLQQILPV